jgi:hypothetical protein
MPTELISRESAIARLRIALISLSEEGKSMCRIATEKNILCGGFHRYTDESLRATYRMLEGAAEMPRADLEERADEWQRERTAMEEVRVCCDVQYRFYETCRGWDDFTNQALAESLFELAGQQVVVRGARTLPVM